MPYPPPCSARRIKKPGSADPGPIGDEAGDEGNGDVVIVAEQPAQEAGKEDETEDGGDDPEDEGTTAETP